MQHFYLLCMQVYMSTIFSLWLEGYCSIVKTHHSSFSFLHQSHFHIKSWQPIGHHYSCAFSAFWHCNEFLFLRNSYVKVNSTWCSFMLVTQKHTPLTHTLKKKTDLVPVAIQTHGMIFQENANSLFLSLMITHTHKYCDCVWCVWGWGEPVGGSGGCICSHAAEMESKTDECAYQDIYSGWLQNKKPLPPLSFFQWPFHPISQHMSFCPPPPPSEL